MILEELQTFMAREDLPDGPWLNNPEDDRVYDWCGRPGGDLAIN
jgi:hypothetical protein